MSDLSMDLSLRQTQKLSTQLLQTMDTLELSVDELKEKIQKEVDTNPTIKVKESSISYNTFSDYYRQSTDKRDDYSDSSFTSSSDEERPDWIEGTVNKKESLVDHLLLQLGMLSIDSNVKETCETLITGLDRNGFTGPDPESLIKDSEKPYLEKAIKTLQALDPVGVGAKDWKDSLILQLKNEGAAKDELALFHKLIYKELDNIKNGKLEEVAKHLKTDIEDVRSMLELLKTLTPFPCLGYNTDYESYITPEIAIKKIDGKLKLVLNKTSLPIVEIDPEYLEMQNELKGKKDEKQKEANKYLKEKLSAASSLISQLEARASLLERTGAVLMEKQENFFLNGPLFLKGLTMKEVADEVGVHEATISRVASSKYIDTDFGIFPIRYLFSSSTTSTAGEDLSKNAIKEMVRNIIQENTSGKPLSDQKIADRLASQGISIARRTISKYRKELDIDSSFKRATLQ